MTVSWDTDQPNPNNIALRNIFGDAVDTVKPATCGARGLSVWGGVFVGIVTLGLVTTH